LEWIFRILIVKGEFLMRKKLIIPGFVCVEFAIIMATVFFTNNSSVTAGYKIDFPIPAYDTLGENTEFVYDLESLSEQISDDSAYVFEEPKKTNYKIASDLGFNNDKFKSSVDGKRVYENSISSLEIDQYGVFSYSSGAKSTIDKAKFAAAECSNIAKEFLNKYGLLNENFSAEPIIEEETNRTIDNRYVTGRTITFYPKKIDKMKVLGNKRISVIITSEGEISYVSYNFREYTKMTKVKLISIEEALKKIKGGSAYIELNSYSDKLIFENVSIHYWDQARNSTDNLAMQPIYVFQGTSVSNGKEEPFSISVQANKV
jgi:hypothetical protein